MQVGRLELDLAEEPKLENHELSGAPNCLVACEDGKIAHHS